MQKEAIIFTSIGGSIGKSIIASAVAESLRQTKAVDAYTCDTNNQHLYNRLGQKNLKSEKNDPTKGVKYIDIRSFEEKRAVIDALTTDSEMVLFDFPADSLDELVKICGSADDLVATIEMCEFRLNINSVIADDKSLVSYKYAMELFPQARHVAIINQGLMAEKGLEKSLLPQTFAAVGDGEHFIVKQRLTKPILDAYAENNMRKVFTPRDEREVSPGVYSPANNAFLLKSAFDQVIWEGFVKNIRTEVKRLYP